MIAAAKKGKWKQCLFFSDH